MLEKLTEAFFPKVCPVCGRIPDGNKMICAECSKEISIIEEPKCIKCGKPLIKDESLCCGDCNRKTHLFEKGVSLFTYEGAFRDSIYRFKYDNAREYADFYGRMAKKLYGAVFKKWNIQTIIPVPLYHQKEIKRGYNQAQVFAKYVSKYTGIPIDEKCIIRKKMTVPQKELSDEMRRENLSGAFAVDVTRASKYKRVLLVDDIYTTGSTIDACAKVLLAAGVEKVYFLCISAGK